MHFYSELYANPQNLKMPMNLTFFLFCLLSSENKQKLIQYRKTNLKHLNMGKM